MVPDEGDSLVTVQISTPKIIFAPLDLMTTANGSWSVLWGANNFPQGEVTTVTAKFKGDEDAAPVFRELQDQRNRAVTPELAPQTFEWWGATRRGRSPGSAAI